jgi:hypothetical protein
MLGSTEEAAIGQKQTFEFSKPAALRRGFKLFGRTLPQDGQQVLVFVLVFPSGEQAEAHAATHSNRLEFSEIFLCDRVLDWIKMQKRPWFDEREAGLEF